MTQPSRNPDVKEPPGSLERAEAMTQSMLACGPYISGQTIAAIFLTFFVAKPAVYFLFVRAFRYRVSRSIPMGNLEAAVIAIARSVIGFVFIGGGFMLFGGDSGADSVLPWVYMYFARFVAWFLIGGPWLGMRGQRLLLWIAGGMAVNLIFDLAIILELVDSLGSLLFVGPAVALTAILTVFGHRTKLRARFSEEPLCHECQYNLTGNLSGRCPECGTPIDYKRLREIQKRPAVIQ